MSDFLLSPPTDPIGKYSSTVIMKIKLPDTSWWLFPGPAAFAQDLFTPPTLARNYENARQVYQLYSGRCPRFPDHLSLVTISATEAGNVVPMRAVGESGWNSQDEVWAHLAYVIMCYDSLIETLRGLQTFNRFYILRLTPA